MTNKTPETIANEVRNGEHLWYAVAEHTNIRVANVDSIPIIMTSLDVAKAVAQEASIKMDTAYEVLSVYRYNKLFRRFMELDK